MPYIANTMALASNGPGQQFDCVREPFGVNDTDRMGDKQQKLVPRAAAAYGRQLKIIVLCLKLNLWVLEQSVFLNKISQNTMGKTKLILT